MIYRGHVKNGVVVLDEKVSLPEGTEVSVEPVPATTSRNDQEIPTLFERLQNVVGIVEGLPADFAENHDHYLHGLPKK